MAPHLISLAGRCSEMATVRLVALSELDTELARRRSIYELAAEVADKIAVQLAAAAFAGGVTPAFGIIGLSFGGRLAVTATQILAARGRTADLVVVGDIIATHDDVASVMQAGMIAEEGAPFERRLLRRIRQPISKIFFNLARLADHRPLRLIAAIARRTAPGRLNRRRVERALLSSIRRAMILGWQPGRVHCRLLLIASAQTRTLYARHGRLLGWETVAPDVRLVEVAGDHAALATDEANLARIVAAIGDAWPDQPPA